MNEVQESFEELIQLLNRLRNLRPSERSLPEGVTSVEMLTLLTIWIGSKHESEVRPSSVASHMHSSSSALSQTLKSLEGKGLLLRTRSQHDSRAVALQLTPAGLAIIEEAERLRRKNTIELVEYIGAEDLQHLNRTLRKMLEYQESSGLMQEPDDPAAVPCPPPPPLCPPPAPFRGVGPQIIPNAQPANPVQRAGGSAHPAAGSASLAGAGTGDVPPRQMEAENPDVSCASLAQASGQANGVEAKAEEAAREPEPAGRASLAGAGGVEPEAPAAGGASLAGAEGGEHPCA